MSEDLISRNEVMKLIESKFADGCLEKGDKTLIDGYILLDDVSDMPTAYDVDKVIEQLKNESRKYEIYAKNETTMRPYHRGVSAGYKFSIEIARRRGGADEQSTTNII